MLYVYLFLFGSALATDLKLFKSESVGPCSDSLKLWAIIPNNSDCINVEGNMSVTVYCTNIFEQTNDGIEITKSYSNKHFDIEIVVIYSDQDCAGQITYPNKINHPICTQNWYYMVSSSTTIAPMVILLLLNIFV